MAGVSHPAPQSTEERADTPAEPVCPAVASAVALIEREYMSDEDLSLFEWDLGETDSTSSSHNSKSEADPYSEFSFDPYVAVSSAFLDRSGVLETIVESPFEDVDDGSTLLPCDASAEESYWDLGGASEESYWDLGEASEDRSWASEGVSASSATSDFVDFDVDAVRNPELWTTAWRCVDGRRRTSATSPAPPSCVSTSNYFTCLESASAGASSAFIEDAASRIAASWATDVPGLDRPDGSQSISREQHLAAARARREDRRRLKREAEDRRRQRRLDRRRRRRPSPVATVESLLPVPSSSPAVEVSSPSPTVSAPPKEDSGGPSSVPSDESPAASSDVDRDALAQALSERDARCSTELSGLSPEDQICSLFPEVSKGRSKRKKKKKRRCEVTILVTANSVSKMEKCEDGSAVADSGATHDLHNRLRDFVTFTRLYNQFVILPNKARLPILGVGNVVIDMGGRRVLLRNVYYVPDIRIPLFSLQVHRRRPGCGHHADNKGFIVTFPDFDVTVNDEVDSHISFRSVSTGVDVSELDYVEPTASERRRLGSITGSAVRRSRRLRAKLAKENGWDRVVSGDFDGEFDELDQEDEELDANGVTFHSPPAAPTPAPVGDPGSSAVPDALPAGETSPEVAPVVEDVDESAEVLKTELVEDVDDSAEVLETESETKPGEVDPTAAGENEDDDDSEGDCITPKLLLAFHSDPSAPAPPVRSCDTPNTSDSRAELTPDIVFRLTGSRRFRGRNGYRNHATVMKSGTATFTNGGEPLQTLGEVVNQRSSPRGGALPPSKHYLDKVHMDIVYGDVISRLGYRYALLLVDRATKYIWVYGLKSLTAVYLIEALEQFQSDAGALPKQFRCDCDQKLLGGDTRRWIYRNKSKVLGAPAGRQSANGLVERAWQTLCSMARAYLTEAGMSRDYWFFAVAHAARMMNYIPGRVQRKLTTPFELVHRVKPDGRTLFPLFSIVYFSLERKKKNEDDTDASGDGTNFTSHSQVGIAVGRSDKTNALRVYSPSTKTYYEPHTYKFDPSRRPSNEWPGQIQYDGGLYINLYRDSHNKVPEPYPPGMPFKLADDDGDLVNVIVSALPVRTAAGEVVREKYLLQKPDGSLVPKTLQEMDELAITPANKSIPVPSATPMVTSLPVWLQHKSKVSMLNDSGDYDKGFIIMSSDGKYRFSCRRQLSSRQESWGVELPDFAASWPRLTCDNILLPSWNVGLYTKLGLKPPSTPYDKAGKLAVSANHVSARDLKSACPKSLKEALAEDAVDRDIWLASYHEEKNSLLDNETFVRLSLQQYRELRLKKNAPRAIPSMCVQTIKKDENGAPDRAKSRIVVLGNLEDRLWEKSDRYAPVLQYSSLRLLTSMAVEKRRKLHQGDFKNAFVQASLPDDEMTIVRPPIGDPDSDLDEFWLLQRSLYGLRRAPKHWYEKMSGSMRAMGLQPSASDPCLFIGVPSTPEHPASPGDRPIQVGIYVDDFVYYSEDDAVESRFESILKSQYKIDFMGIVNWFLGTHFEWADHIDGALSVHLSQRAFAQNLVERHRLGSSNLNPSCSPYRSGVPIDSVPAAEVDESDPAFVRRRHSYQSLVGGLNWLACNTRPDLSTAVSFLAAYSHCPSKGHMEAALYVVKYLRSTASHGIAFHSSAPATSEAYVHYPFPHDAEAYHDASTVPHDKPHLLSVYTDANFGSQLGNSVPDGTEVEMFKFRSISGYLIMRCGGPIAWRAARQDRCSRSTCEAEVTAIDEATKDVLSLRHRCEDMHLPDSSIPTPVFNDNSGAVQWSKNTTSKGMRHVNVRHCAVRDSVRAKEIAIFHINGKVNPSDIFTKEMRDTKHFCTLRDSFMMSTERFSTFVGASSAWVSASCVAGDALF